MSSEVLVLPQANPPAAATDKGHPHLAIEARGLGKRYELFERPVDRLKQLVWGRWRRWGRPFWALHDVSFEIPRGEVLGVIGRNGAGKSTLLHLVCGTLQPSVGALSVQGRVAPLLELGAGFNPHFSGRENVYLNAAVLGLSRPEVEARMDDILAFADIGEFIEQPVRTYSTGMFMRLAFAVATSVEPDVLVIDEALSVGDGAFGRKSFDRIMGMKDAGKTILFCSHSTYQVEAMCSRALWIDRGTVRMSGPASEVTAAYTALLNHEGRAHAHLDLLPAATALAAAPGTGRIVRIKAQADGGAEGSELAVRSGETNVDIHIGFVIDPDLPVPSVAVGISDASGLTVASAGSHNDGVSLRMDAQGRGQVSLRLERLPLLKGLYTVTCFLASEDALHIYDQVLHAITLNVTQRGFEQGLVSLPHRWTP